MDFGALHRFAVDGERAFYPCPGRFRTVAIDQKFNASRFVLYGHLEQMIFAGDVLCQGLAARRAPPRRPLLIAGSTVIGGSSCRSHGQSALWTIVTPSGLCARVFPDHKIRGPPSTRCMFGIVARLCRRGACPSRNLETRGVCRWGRCLFCVELIRPLDR